MDLNQSPWIKQLHRTRPITPLEVDTQTDVIIIGGGIAGVSTAYYTLQNTNKKVILVEGNKIAHGATGHNGGFLASYFERSFTSIAQEFGLAMAAEGQRAIESAWILLDEIQKKAQLKTPSWQFTGYAGCATIDEIISHLRDNALRLKAGLQTEIMLVSEEANARESIPGQYKTLYRVVPKREILELLETSDDEYIGILPERKGCMNSALFTEELAGYLLSHYPERFILAEHSLVKAITLYSAHATVELENAHVLTSQNVVLCTNGFENFRIINTVGANINAKFHHLVRGIIGYMAGYIEEDHKNPAEISYLPKNSKHTRDIYNEDPYFYLTRRPYQDTESAQSSNLICIGGPEVLMDDTNNYQPEHPYSREARDQIDNFLRYTYKRSKKDTIEYKFLWHGLMGFTPNGIRLIGPEPNNTTLLYNLGCNGVGLLPSIYGGQKISFFLTGLSIPKSIFDPRDYKSLNARLHKNINKPKIPPKRGTTSSNFINRLLQ